MLIHIIFSIVILVCSYWLLCAILGTLAKQHNIKINYTRKIGHFSMFIFPGIVYAFFNIIETADKLVIASLSSIIFFISLSQMFRRRFKYLASSFHAIDRPEDRPYTLGFFLRPLSVF